MAGTDTRIHSEPDLRSFVGQWVVLHEGSVIEHGTELNDIVEKARAKGIQRPPVLYVEDRDPESVKLGL